MLDFLEIINISLEMSSYHLNLLQIIVLEKRFLLPHNWMTGTGKEVTWNHKNGRCFCFLYMSLTLLAGQSATKAKVIIEFYTRSMHLGTLPAPVLYCSWWGLMCWTFPLCPLQTEQRTHISLARWRAREKSGFASQSDNMCKYILQRWVVQLYVGM